MSFSDIVDLCSDNEIGEAHIIKREQDSILSKIQRKKYSKAKQIQDCISNIHVRRQESEESRSSSALNDGQSSFCMLDQGDSPTEGSSISSASPGCSVPLCRQFWKAGDYDVRQSSKAALQNEKNHLRVHPKFLHSNATSHKWAFGAIAELLDNAVDEIQNGATYVIVDKISNPRDGSPALVIQDDGGGMDPDSMRCCMSFGFSDKKSKSAIGQCMNPMLLVPFSLLLLSFYHINWSACSLSDGNGFKTSTMRLGADVIVFSRHMCKRTLTQSVGLLSYTFLRQTGQDRVVVPMVDYEFNTSTGTLGTLFRYGEEHFSHSLSMLLQWSPYATEEELLKQFDDIGHHGTKVIIYNLWINDDGDMELDFESDAEDIVLSGPAKKVLTGYYSKTISEQHIANRFHYSLRVYSSILYLRMPQSFRMVLRGQVVEHHNIANDLKFPEYILYRPQIGGNMEATVVTTIGFLNDAPLVNIHGFNVYHRNRLILPFWRVFSQTYSRGRGVVGILEANFIQPTHNKQDFEKTSLFQKLESRLKQMTLEYWDFHCELIGYRQTKKSPAPAPPCESPPSGTCSGLQPVMMIRDSPAIKSLIVASAVGDSQDPAETSTHPLVGRSGQSVCNRQMSSQHGLPIKRKEHGHTVEPDLVKRQVVLGVNVTDTRHNWEAQPLSDIDDRLQDQETISLMQENKKLRAQCLEYEKMEKELSLKVQQLRSELAEVQRDYASLLAESQVMDAIKVENM